MNGLNVNADINIKAFRLASTTDWANSWILQTIASDPASLYDDKNVGDAPANSYADEECQEAAVLRRCLECCFAIIWRFPCIREGPYEEFLAGLGMGFAS